MGGREHHAEVGAEVGGQVGDRRGRQDADVEDVDAGAGQAGDDRRREELTGGTRVAADDGARPVPRERADVAEDVGRGDREVERELGRQVAVGHATHAVGAEEASHERR